MNTAALSKDFQSIQNNSRIGAELIISLNKYYYISEVMNELETNDDEIHDSEDEESESDTDDELKDDNTLVVLKNGIKIKQKKTPRVIKYVRFRVEFQQR